MANSYTITETYTLPSKGKLYSGCPEQVTLRSMTTEEEMRRLSRTDTPHKTMCDIIDACIIEELPLSVYDMCIGDYQFLLYKLRTVTYGSKYLNSTICPFCGQVNKHTIDLDELDVNVLQNVEEFEELLSVTLPRSKCKVKLHFRTPRILEAMEKDQEDFQHKFPQNEIDTSILFRLKHSIDSIDNQHYDSQKLENFIRKLPGMDMNILEQTLNKIDEKVGISDTVEVTCTHPKCGANYYSSFRFSSEFFRPTI